MKHARAYLEQRQVVSSYWAAPLLRGVVQAGGTSVRASMVIKSSSDIENLYFADGSTFPDLPAKNLTFTLMANASRIAEEAF